jgi:Domain of unknown function (DUF6815)
MIDRVCAITSRRGEGIVKALSVALVWPADAGARTVEASRLAGVGAALREVGLRPLAAVYSDDAVDETRRRLVGADAVLVWVNPGEQGRERAGLDAMLRDVAEAGVLVSAHPDTIDAIGTKEILHRTKDLGWGSDTRLYTTWDQFAEEFPRCLAEGHARVLKPSRGNGGNGVWKVGLDGDARNGSASFDSRVVVRHAARGSVQATMDMGDFMAGHQAAFAGGGAIIDQVYQPRLTEGMIRCYLTRDRVVGFGEQLVNALYPAPPGGRPEDAPQPGPRLYYPPTRPDLQPLKTALETAWVPALCAGQGLGLDELPVIWDADFIHGPIHADGGPDYVLCEINASSVYPFPDDALQPLAQEVLRRLTGTFDRSTG